MHSDLAPSSAGRWTVCTASVDYIQRNPSLMLPSGGKSADEGTLAHLLLTNRLLGRPDPAGVNVEMLSHIQGMLIWLKGAEPENATVLVDQKVPLFYAPKDTGTLDYAAIGPKGARVTDLKYGVAVSVEAENNPQLLAYAESLFRQLEDAGQLFSDDYPITLAIYQPRDSSNREPVREWKLNRQDLASEAAKLSTAADDILNGDLRFVAGPHCTKYFCPARGACAAFAALGFDRLPDEDHKPASLARPSALAAPQSLTHEQRIRVLDAADNLRDWLKAVEELEAASLLRGEPGAGYKLVEGRSNRQWASEETAFAFLSDYLPPAQIVPPSDIISPAVAEKLLPDAGKKAMKAQAASLITKPNGKAVLVPESDKRQALTFTPVSVMPVVSDGWDYV